jgi:hypothetical protein
MPLARLENFLKNLNGNTLYVDPSELDATDSIENRGNSRLRPFKTIQRALIEAARFSYIAGSNNDLFDQTTILISPGTHYIDNRPGYYVDASNNIKDINNSSKNISEFSIISNFDITDVDNELYIYNSVDGGVILPKGTSLVATDLRKTKIRPLFVPDPESAIDSTAIFRVTGSCYVFGFTVFDGDPLGKVFNTYGTNKVTPSYSHHKLTAFEYADGVNNVIRNSSDTGYTDLDMYYYKLSLGYGQQSGRSILDGYLNFQPNVDEYRIVGELGVGSIGISSVRSGNGVTGTNVITVDTVAEHGLTPLTPILINGVGVAEGSPTTGEYNGNFIVAQVISDTQFTYLTSSVPTGSLLPSTADAEVKVISDTTTSSSPYIFNCSLKSVYGMNGLHADGSKATGFRSMVTAQFTGISLQKDDRAFVQYDQTTGGYLDQDSFGITKFLHQEPTSVYHPDWSSFHIKASNDAFIQCVSIFAIGYANQFVADDGGDQSITNSNSNFGQNALLSGGFKPNAFPKDNHGFITHLIPPKDVSVDEQNITVYSISSTNGSNRIYLKEYDDILNPPKNKIRGYAIGGRTDDKVYYKVGNDEYSATISPNGKIETNITSINTSTDQLTLSSVSGISTGLSVKIVSKNSLLPDGIVHDQTYFVRPTSGTNIEIYENLTNCNAGTNRVDIKNVIGVTSNNLYLVSRVSERSSGSVGSPIQWDDTVKNWYISITSPSTGFISNITGSVVYLKRIFDSRSNDDRVYRARYVIPKDALNPAVPSSGFVFQKSGSLLNDLYPQAEDVELDSLSASRNQNVIVDAYYDSGTATIVTKKSHNLKVGNKVSIYNLKSSNEPSPVGLGSGTGFNGQFEVSSVTDDLTFSYTISLDPGTITVGVSTVANWLSIPRNCSQSSNFEIPPYTIYNDNRNDLPFFTCDQVENNYQAYQIKQIQKYVSGSTDGIYHITLDVFKNTPSASPFNTSEYKFGQSLDNLYPQKDFDNLTVDPDPSTTEASRSTIGLVNINDPYLSSTKETVVEFLKDFDLGKIITGFVKSGSNVTITTAENHGLEGIRRVELDTLGSGYLDGKYYDIPLCGGTGENATINFEVVSGVVVNNDYFRISNSGSGYSVGDSLTIKGIPGSTSTTTVTIPVSQGLNFDSNNSDTIQIFGATNSGNNGAFVITSVTPNTITFSNSSGATEATTNAVFVMSGIGYPIDSAVYNSTTGITTVYTPISNPHSFAVGNKVLFNSGGLGICTVTSVSGLSTVFTVKGNVSSATRTFSVGFIPTLKDTNSLNENLNTRAFVPYSSYKSELNATLSTSGTQLFLNDGFGLKKGDFIQIANEIMLVTRISGSTTFVRRGLFGTQAVEHLSNSSVKTIQIIPVELRRPSILRASGHTFEYVGFGPGNYSTAMPSNQTEVLDENKTRISQALPNRGGQIAYSGLNSNGEFFIGGTKWDAATGAQIGGNVNVTNTAFDEEFNFDTLVLNNLIVNSTIDASTAVQTLKNLTVSGDSSFNSDLSIGFNLDVGGTLSVGGTATFSSDVNIVGVTSMVGNLYVNGNIFATQDITAFYTSDRRLKDNITPIPNALDKVVSISGNTFDWNDISGKEGSEAGVIAQEILEVLPEAVVNRSNGYLAVRYEQLVPLLIEAIKDLKKEVDEIKGEK